MDRRSTLTFHSTRRSSVGVVDRYRISQLAERVGLRASTLRYYETQGLLPAQRTSSGYRTYDDRDVERVRFIGTAKTLGLSLDRIRELIGVWQHGACRDVRDRLRPEVHEQIDHASRCIGELVEFRESLLAAIARLDGLPDRDTPCDPTCSFLTSDPKERPKVQPPTGIPDTAPPIACSLTATEYADRAARWRAVVAGTTRTRLPDDGIRVHFPTEQAEEIAALVAAESRCCPFFTFSLTFSSSGAVLDAHAPADAAPLLDELFGPDTPASAC